MSDSCDPLDPVLHQGVKCIPRRDGHRDAESLRDLLVDLHETEHARNSRFRIVVDEIAIGSRRANGLGAEHEQPSRAVLAQSGIVRPQDLDQGGLVHGSQVATIRAGKRACRSNHHSGLAVRKARSSQWRGIAAVADHRLPHHVPRRNTIPIFVDRGAPLRYTPSPPKTVDLTLPTFVRASVAALSAPLPECSIRGAASRPFSS